MNSLEQQDRKTPPSSNRHLNISTHGMKVSPPTAEEASSHLRPSPARPMPLNFQPILSTLNHHNSINNNNNNSLNNNNYNNNNNSSSNHNTSSRGSSEDESNYKKNKETFYLDEQQRTGEEAQVLRKRSIDISEDLSVRNRKLRKTPNNQVKKLIYNSISLKSVH